MAWYLAWYGPASSSHHTRDTYDFGDRVGGLSDPLLGEPESQAMSAQQVAK
jgi:hypothetical protein